MSDTILTNDAAWVALRHILDPEFGVSIVDLGLIYSVDCRKGNIHVVMTLTTPTCPAGSWIHEGVKTALQQMDATKEVRVDLVFEPPWNANLLTAEGRSQLGFEG